MAKAHIRIEIGIDAEYEGQEGYDEMMETINDYFDGNIAIMTYHHLPYFKWTLSKQKPKIIKIQSYESDLHQGPSKRM